MQIQTRMNHYLTTTRIARTKKSDKKKNKYWQGCRKIKTLRQLWSTTWNSAVTLENSLAVPRIIKYRVTIWPSTSIPRYTPERNESVRPHKSVCIGVTATLFTVTRWKPPKCSSTNKWINKIYRYIHTTEYYSTIKRNKVLIHAKTWRSLKIITLNERCQSQKTTYNTMPFIWYIQNREIDRDKK